MHLCIYRLLPNRLHPRPHRRKIVKMPRLKQEAQCKRGRFCNAEALQIRLSTKTQVAPQRPPPTLLMQLLLESQKLRLAFFSFSIRFLSQCIRQIKTTKFSFYVNNKKFCGENLPNVLNVITACWGSKLKNGILLPKLI